MQNRRSAKLVSPSCKKWGKELCGPWLNQSATIHNIWHRQLEPNTPIGQHASDAIFFASLLGFWTSGRANEAIICQITLALSEKPCGSPVQQRCLFRPSCRSKGEAIQKIAFLYSGLVSGLSSSKSHLCQNPIPLLQKSSHAISGRRLGSQVPALLLILYFNRTLGRNLKEWGLLGMIKPSILRSCRILNHYYP